MSHSIYKFTPWGLSTTRILNMSNRSFCQRRLYWRTVNMCMNVTGICGALRLERTTAADGSIYSWEEGRNGGANARYMIPTNMTFLIKKSPSCFVCCKCATKLANYYVLIGRNTKSATQIIPICDVRYSEQYNTRRRRNNRRWYYHQHLWNGEVHSMLVASVNKMLILYVLETLLQSAQTVKPAMLESLAIKPLK